MTAAANRVLLAFKSWEGRKKEMEPLLKAGMADQPTINRLQLEHMRRAQHRLRGTARSDEKPFMALLQNHVAKLEKQLYPNLLRRLFSQLKNRLIDGPDYLKQEKRQRADNMEALKTQLREAGMGHVAGKLENHLDTDQQKVCLPLYCQLQEGKALQFGLHFEQDPYGNFQLRRLDGSLLQDGKVVRSHKFELSGWPNLKTNQAWGLLEGRAIKQTYTDASGHENRRWVELGPNSAQHYAPDYAFDAKTAVAGLPAMMGSKPELIRYLENGQAAPAYWKAGNQYQRVTVQADPANQSLKFFDEKNRPVTPDQLNQRAEKMGLRAKPIAHPAQNRRMGVKNGQRV